MLPSLIAADGVAIWEPETQQRAQRQGERAPAVFAGSKARAMVWAAMVRQAV